jgi:L-lactate dehydrogenase (cytochrome)
MRLIGASSVGDLDPTMIDTTGLKMHTTSVPADTLSLKAYDSLITPSDMQEGLLKAKL